MNKPILTWVFGLIGILAFFFLIIAIGQWAWIVYQDKKELNRHYEPIIIHSIKTTNPNNQVLAGGKYLYDADLAITEDYLNATCVLKRAMVNGYNIIYDAQYPPKKHLGRQIVKGDLDIPPNTKGKWYMRWTVECKNGRLGIPTVVTYDMDKTPVMVISEDHGNGRGQQGIKGDKGEPGKNFWGK